MFSTASFHIVKPCNMGCKFCYATFHDLAGNPPQLPLQDAKAIITKLRDGGLEKITFAGGEPLLYKDLDEIIIFSKRLGLTTSVITNGSLIRNEWLQRMKGWLDWIGLSIDSLSPTTNERIGRVAKDRVDYIKLVELLRSNRFKLKINTVVNAYNKAEDMNAFLRYAVPARWKVLQALRVEGQNDEQFEEIRVTSEEFINFVARHQHIANIVPESNADMTGSYLLVDPLGRLFENSEGCHTYSDTLQDHELDHCLAQLKFDAAAFERRGGNYNW